jgi:CubicO group peptidase (beta-lactamase class C family)
MFHSSELPRSTPEAQGIASSAIQAFIDTIEQERLGVHSFVLVRNGHIVADGWWKPYASHLPHSMFSVSKSFTSTAIGLAISEGRLSLDDPILSFFPSYVTPEIRDNMGALQIRHLLSMSTGHAEDTIGLLTSSPNEDWVHTFLSLPITYPPGTHFIYNSGASFMLSAILQSLTDQTLVEYLNPRLFQPLGIDKPIWQSNKRGINVGSSGLSIRTGDLAKFGQLYLQRGVWNGQSIVPEAWIEEATRIQISNGEDPDSDWSQGYGFQFWRSRHNAYRADGAFGQFCLVMPEQNAVLVSTSGTTDMQSILNAAWEHLLPAMNAQPLLESSQESHTLKERLAHLALPLPKALPAEPSTAARISARTLQLEPNSLHINKVSFTFDQNTCTCTIRDDKDTQHIIHCGQADWILSESSLWRPEGSPAVSLRVAAHGGWTDDHTFVMTWQYIETPFSHIITFGFHPDEIDVSIRLDLPFWVERNEQFHGRLM